MIDDIRNTHDAIRYVCSCGLPGFVDIANPDSHLSGLPFGRYPCKGHYHELLEQRQRDLAEYMTCFTPEWPGWPSEYQVQKALLENKVKEKTIN